MGGTSTARALFDLVAQIEKTPGWRVIEQRRGSGVIIHAPGGGQTSFNREGNGGRKLPNVLAQLRRLGWDPDGADKAKEREAKRRLAAAQEKNASALDKAQEEGRRRAHAENLAKARTALAAAEVQLRATRLAHDRATRDHRRALDHLTRLERTAP
ncbi:hypothetical protein [Streptomyces sp. NPDC058157]|uniref:hypothetical protein n=1 Tax=Streptomyces sp. NPDC058157 TaxID=3346360 RepID=UPI0036E1E321